MPQLAGCRWVCAGLLAALGVALGGCASGGWLSRGGGEIPVGEESPSAARYPTALTGRDSQARPAPSSEQTTHKPAAMADAEQVAQAEPATPTKSPAPPPEIKAPLAVFPPALRIDPVRTIPSPDSSPALESPPPPATGPLANSTSVHPAAASEPIVEIITPAVANSLPSAPALVTSVAPLTTPPALAPPPAMSEAERLAAISQQRDVLIAMLEDEIRTRQPNAKSDPELPRLEQHLRLLYAAAGRGDDATLPVESLPAAEREAYKHLSFGLATWLAPDEQRRAPLRNARVLRSLRDATSQLAAASKLDLRNLAFCEKVEYFGWYSEFSRYEFQPKQQVILYVEIDNFTALEKGPHSFETELQGSYQIFDETGNVVAQRTLPLDREVCRNYRRDYFLAYRVFMPDEIAAGRYRLELTIEDRKAAGEFKGKKLGEGLVEFTIRN
ncbi:MAG: hypothetical protein SFU86_12895 [Pirellulaceae bacterium]|nr:hypothetical protein [Pirellulaceae bacterium]